MVKKHTTPASAQPTEQGPLLAVQQISFGYTNVPLLQAVSLRVESGEMLGLLGPNGTGKTTLLRLLSGLLQPQEGTILLEGRDLRSWQRRALARRIAVVPQELKIPFAFTVEHMVSLGRTPFIDSFWGTLSKNDHQIIQDAMRATEVMTLATRVFNELSGGEQQRVLIAMALAQEPALLLLDEPTAHLDLKYQVETLALIQRLNREQGVTIIAAMHDLNLASRYFPRLLLFQHGIVADASPTEVLTAEQLSHVYGIATQVGILRGAHYLSILPPDNEPHPDHNNEQARVHVMAGGGSGELLMRALADAAVPFSAGPLQIGDSDHVLALHLAKAVITAQPYAPLSPTILQQLDDHLNSTHLLILTPFPIGPGNLSLLSAALAALQQGTPVLLLVPAKAVPRDYSDGPATHLLTELVRSGATEVPSIGDVLHFLSIHSLMRKKK